MIVRRLLDARSTSRVLCRLASPTTRYYLIFPIMRPTLSLRMYAARLTLFTKHQCGLCDKAKVITNNVLTRRTAEYHEIDVMKPENEKYYNMYAFDVPVLHVNRVFYTYSKPDIVSKEKKLFHRWTEKEVEMLIDEAEKGEEDVKSAGSPGHAG